MKDFIRLFAQIALLRRGPQDVPASALLLVLTVIAYFIVNSLVSFVLPPVPGPWAAHLLLDVAFTLAWYYLLLKLAGRPERILQTTTAVFGFQAVLSPVLVASGWLVRRAAPDSAWQYLVLIPFAWFIAANGQVVKAALEWSIATSVALVILQILAGYLLEVAVFPGGT
jgi:hypothetical protein